MVSAVSWCGGKMIHKFKAETKHADYHLVLCGRIVRRNRTTLALTQVGCQNCRKAFARILRSLPNVFPITDKLSS